MGRNSNEEFYGAGVPNSYLTPDQRIDEQNHLVAADLASRSRPVDNPLIQSTSVLGQPSAVAAPPPDVSSNPLVPPPVPLSTMGTDQRIAWQQLNSDQLAKQTANDSAMLEQEIKRRADTHRAEELRQSKELISKSADLDPTDLKGYTIARAKLAREFPIGAGSDEVTRALAPLDAVHNKVAEADAWYQKQLQNQTFTQDQQRVVEARKQAEALGPDAISRFFQLQKDKGNEVAIQDVMEQGAVIKQANLVAQLQKAGMSPEEIAKTYHGGATGEPFLYGAAEAEAKVRVPPGMERQRATNVFNTLYKLRKDADDGTDPEKWTPAMAGFSRLDR